MPPQRNPDALPPVLRGAAPTHTHWASRPVRSLSLGLRPGPVAEVLRDGLRPGLVVRPGFRRVHLLLHLRVVDFLALRQLDHLRVVEVGEGQPILAPVLPPGEEAAAVVLAVPLLHMTEVADEVAALQPRLLAHRLLRRDLPDGAPLLDGGRQGERCRPAGASVAAEVILLADGEGLVEERRHHPSVHGRVRPVEVQHGGAWRDRGFRTVHLPDAGGLPRLVDIAPHDCRLALRRCALARSDDDGALALLRPTAACQPRLGDDIEAHIPRGREVLVGLPGRALLVRVGGGVGWLWAGITRDG
mmetsp:Transcript_15819/g.49398  ORF Transcript_15819/g.49398 Transcript_15819/m.49398 type:complete len:302 (+) Transcript_15819:3-908(+)